MPERSLLMAFILILGSPERASAGSGDANVDCANANSTYEMNVCAERDFEAADKALNETYRAALAEIAGRGLEKPFDDKSFEEAMRVAQRAWIAYRDADCKNLVAQEWTGGSGTTVAVLSCMIEKTEQRSKELKERYGLEPE